MKKNLILFIFLSLKSICASDADPYGLTLLTDEDLAELGILNLPPDPAIPSSLPYNLGMVEQGAYQLNPLQEEDFAALGLLNPAAYTVLPSRLEGAVSIGEGSQNQYTLPDQQDSPVAASSQNSHFLPDVFKSGELSAPGPMRRLRERRKVAEKEQSLNFCSEDEEESAQIEESSDVDYDDRSERASFRKGKTKKESRVKEFKCLDSGCSQTFEREWDMRIHYRKIHEGELAERCERCNKYYGDKSDLGKHRRGCENKKDPKNKKRSFCPYSGCGRVYKNDEFLKAHIARDHAQQAESTE